MGDWSSSEPENYSSGAVKNEPLEILLDFRLLQEDALSDLTLRRSGKFAQIARIYSDLVFSASARPVQVRIAARSAGATYLIAERYRTALIPEADRAAIPYQ